VTQETISKLARAYPWARLHTLNYPVRLDELADVLAEIRAAYRKVDYAAAPQGDGRLIGSSADTEVVRGLIRKVAPSMATVLITGESGTGKEVVARQIHEQSGRPGPFVAVNCGAIPENLLESELFGHERGAFTGAVRARPGRFEQAEGGTFFLDEIGDMPAVMQVKLLRVLEERVIERVGAATSIPIDVRVIAATHRDLPRRIEAGEFREDLYYRLSVFPIEIKPLRDRPDDIPPLVEEFLRRHQAQTSVSLQFADDAMAALQAHAWPGNVRELANLVERLIVIKANGTVMLTDLPWMDAVTAPSTAEEFEVLASRLQSAGTEARSDLPSAGLDLKQHLATVEQNMIRRALRDADGVVQRAAEILGIGRTTLVEKIKRYELNTPSDDG
jgi:sigma-54 specific flagellar transcriptional regulator A